MSRMIAYCGLVCSDCPTFVATQNDDDAARAQTAAFYSEKFGFDLKPEEINCDGCKSDAGKLIGYCRSCDIRRCCLAEKVWTTAQFAVISPVKASSSFISFPRMQRRALKRSKSGSDRSALLAPRFFRRL